MPDAAADDGHGGTGGAVATVELASPDEADPHGREISAADGRLVDEKGGLAVPALDTEIPVEMNGAERTPVHQPDRSHVWNPLQAIEEITVKDLQPRHLRIRGFREIEVERPRVSGGETRSHGLKPEEALEQQSSASQQHQRDGDLTDDERAPQALLAGTERTAGGGQQGLRGAGA